MTINRWWHAAAVVMSSVLAAILLLSPLTPGRLALGLGAIAVFLLSWVLLSKRAFDGNSAALAMTAVTVAVAGAGTAAQPNVAIFRCLGFPLVWILAKGLHQAIIANIVLALAVGIGFLLNQQLTQGDLLEILLTVVLSLGFSLVLGLWITQICTLSEDRQALVTELQATQSQLSVVSRDAGVTAERERLAREIHDTIAQDLTGLVMLAQRARRETDAAARDSELAQLEERARETLTETRALVADGAPASLDGGLAAALDRLATRFTRDTGITVSVTTDDRGLDRDTEVVVLRCTQESLANVRKHSAARTASVSLRDGTLVIRDDGHGFDPGAPATGFGLSGMRDRLALVGGRIDVASGASGTTLTISLAELHA